MPIILKIGYQEFLVKNDAAAMKAMQALCGAVRMESRHIGSGSTYREVFWTTDRESEISIKTIQSNQIVKSGPCDKDIDVDVEPLRKQIGL